MIRRLKYHEIDFEKYTECLENSEQRKYSATKHFLDITSDKQWELIVLNNYEAVMPVPYIKKLGMQLIINPKLCQQLGIFSKIDIIEINDQFLNFFEKKYNIWYYAFNDVNTFTKQLKKRKNFLIYPTNYEEVRRKYSPKRKRKLRYDEDVLSRSEIKEVKIKEIRDFISENIIGVKDEKDKEKFLQTFIDIENENHLKVIAFFYESTPINAIAVYFDEKTLALLGTFNNKDFIKLSGSSIIIDNTIAKNIEHKIFDFEGSEVPSIEEFFRGFRPELKMYPVIINSKKTLIKNILKI